MPRSERAQRKMKKDSRGRGVKDSSERQGSKTLEPSNPGILEPYFRIMVTSIWSNQSVGPILSSALNDLELENSQRLNDHSVSGTS